MELELRTIALDYAQIEDAGEEEKADDSTKAQAHEVNAPRDEKAPSKPRKRRLMIGRDRWTKQVMAHLV